MTKQSYFLSKGSEASKKRWDKQRAREAHQLVDVFMSFYKPNNDNLVEAFSKMVKDSADYVVKNYKLRKK